MMGPAGGGGEVAEYWDPGCHLSEQVVPGLRVHIRVLPLDESLVLYEPQFPHPSNGDKSHVSWQMDVVRRS